MKMFGVSGAIFLRIIRLITLVKLVEVLDT